MQEYVYFVHDDRQDSPVRRRAQLQGVEDACRLAQRMLRETYHHLSVEVWSQGERVVTVSGGDADAVA